MHSSLAAALTETLCGIGTVSIIQRQCHLRLRLSSLRKVKASLEETQIEITKTFLVEGYIEVQGWWKNS